MSRFLTVGAAQMGPIQRSHTRRDVVERLIAHLREAKRMGCDVVVFPELTLTTFFPRWWMTDQSEIDSFFEREMPCKSGSSKRKYAIWRSTSPAISRATGSSAMGMALRHRGTGDPGRSTRAGSRLALRDWESRPA